jgi:hypothetical protein
MCPFLGLDARRFNEANSAAMRLTVAGNPDGSM